MSLDNTARHHLTSLIRHRDLRLLLGAGLVSQTGDWILGTGIAFQVYVLTGSTVASAVTLLATQAPQMVFGTVAGVLVDRWDRRRVMVAVNLLLGVALIPLFSVRGAAQVWVIFVVVAASSCLTPFFVAAEATLLPSLVAAEDLVTANAVNAQVRNVSRLVGAALGGLIIATGGLGWLAAVDIASFGLAALLIGLIRHRPERTAYQRLRLVRDWVEGLAAIRSSRALVVVLIFFAVSGVGEAVMGTLFAPFVSDVLGGSAGDFGTILAAQAVGGIAGGVLITVVGHRVPPRVLFGGGAVVFGLGDIALFLYPLLSRQVWPALVIIALVGLPGAALFAGMLTVFQTHTDDHVRGRVFGTLTTVQNATMLASTYAAGALAAPVGILPVITAQGVAYVLVGIVILALLTRRSTATRDGSSRSDGVDLTSMVDNPANSTMLPTMSLASNVRTRTVTDPLALRALAHPIRVELHSLVGREGSVTAADAARQLGISHALASHHLRQLAKYGFIEPAETPDHRAHPWRITATDLDLKPGQPDAQTSIDALDRHAVDQAGRDLAAWQDRRAQEDTAWSDPTRVHNSLLYLSPQELFDLHAGWSALVEPLAARRPLGHAVERPADAVPVSLTLVAVPVPPTAQNG